MKIPVYSPSIGEEEKHNVLKCLDTGWISSRGEFIELFENKFAEKNSIKYAASVCNGTVALHVALLALGISEGDEVIVPTLTYIASVNAIKYCNAVPVFTDSSYDDWQIDPVDIEKKITNKTKAIMVVHLYGHPCDMTRIMEISKKYNIPVVEDCAEAFGSKHHDKLIGTFGDISTFSFFGNKTITTGEGGMVITNSEDLDEKVRHIKGQGLAKNRQYWHNIVGYNYRMTNIAAAIGVAQLDKADKFITQKREIANRYKNALDKKYLFHTETSNNFHTYWMCSILIREGGIDERDRLRQFLDQKGIETRPLFYPVHTMPMYKSPYKFNVAQDISARGINLPSYPTLSVIEQDYIIDTLLSFK